MIDPELARRVAVISGPTAVGKGTVVARLAAEHPDEIWVSVSATTRAPRPAEIDGVHYLFLTNDEFDALVASGGLLEWALVHKTDRYGTPRQPVIDALHAGKRVILEIELQGARQVRETWPAAQTIFLEPPSWEELVHRLVGRGTESEAQRERRLETARTEMAAADEFDHVVINDDLSETVGELVSLLGLRAPAAPDQARL